MHFIENNFYHIYNRGNNKEVLFKSRNDYLRFLNLIATHLPSVCNILAWCLMPNHFHFFIYTDKKSVETKKSGGLMLQKITIAIKISLSSYTKYYNKKHNRTGNLFQQKTKAKLIEPVNYPLQVFHYVHQNPWKAHLVSLIEDWEFCSFRDYIHLRNGKLCNKQLAILLLDLDNEHLYKETYNAITKEFEYLVEK